MEMLLCLSFQRVAEWDNAVIVLLYQKGDREGDIADIILYVGIIM